MAQIRTLRPGDEPALEAFLRPRLETSMFLLGNARQAGLTDRGQPLEGTYVGAFEGGALVGVVGHFWNGNLLPQAPPKHLIALGRAAVAASGRPIAGAVGPLDQVDALLAAFSLKRHPYKLNAVERLYRLPLERLALPEALAQGRVRGRRARDDDLETLTDWRVAFSVESLGEARTSELAAHCRESVARAIAGRAMWVLEADGAPAACSAFNATLPEAVQVGGVYTPPELRGRGYARAAVAASLLDARAAGVGLAMLFTDEDNVPAQRAYAALGFGQVGHFGLTLLKDPVFPS